MLSIVLMLIVGGICLIVFCNRFEEIGLISFSLGIALMIAFSLSFYGRQFTAIVDDKPDIIRGQKGSVNGVIVAVSSTKKGCVVASSDNILWQYIPNSNVVIQANAGYNIWGKAGTNNYEITVK